MQYHLTGAGDDPRFRFQGFAREQAMRLRWALGMTGLLLLPVLATTQETGSKMDEKEIKEYILFHQIVQVAPSGGARDVSFAQGNLEAYKPHEVVWVLDAQKPGLAGIASRPIRETARAGEAMGRIGDGRWRAGEAAHVRAGQDGAYVLESNGLLWWLRGGKVDSLRIGNGVASAADVDGNSSGLIAVLWGREVLVFLSIPGPPLWRFDLEADLEPEVALAVSAAGEIFVTGRGATALAVYDVDASGTYRRVRSAAADKLGIAAAGGVEVTPFMIMPSEGREAYVDQDRFVLISDPEGGSIVALEAAALKPAGRWDVRAQLLGAAPGRLDVSNRGQIAYVDLRSGECQVLPTRVTIAMVEGAKFRWRVLEAPNMIRIQGGDTVQIEPPRH